MEPNHTTARNLGPLQIVQSSLTHTVHPFSCTQNVCTVPLHTPTVSVSKNGIVLFWLVAEHPGRHVVLYSFHHSVNLFFLKVWWPYATLFAFIFLYTIQ